MIADSSRLRLGILGVVALSLFAVLFGRLWFLQVLSAPSFKQAAERNRIRVITEPAPRGRILDRDGAVLVENRASNVVSINRSELEEGEREPLLDRLAAVVDQPAPILEIRLDNPRVGPFSPVPVATDLPEEAMVYLKERSPDFPGVTAERVAVRTFPQGTLAAHLIGYVGEVSEEELGEPDSPYEAGDFVGKAGIEQTFDPDLRGVDGQIRLEVDADGEPVRVVDRRPPVTGDDVVLSIDLEAQRAAETALAQGMEAARGRRFTDDREALVADGGSVVALDAKEGTVAALASYPTFDPAQPERSFADPSSPLTNRAVQGQYAPGSTWKLVTATAAQKSGLVTPESVVNDQGRYRIPDCSGKCVFRNAGSARYGPVDMARALTVSSDVYFYTQGYDLWARRGELGETQIQDTAVDFGFGSETGLPVQAEADGRIPTPDRRAELHEEDPDSFPEGKWYPGDNLNLAIGQGELTVTPVQLANAYATFARKGERFEPNLALRVQEPDGTVVREVERRPAEAMELAPELWSAIMAGLTGATTDPKGTAQRAFAGFPLDQFPVAGKTGTAQAEPKQDTALFAAVAPAPDPRYAVSVVMEQAGFGATSAAPVARRVLGVLSGLEVPDRVRLVSGGRG